MKTKSKKLPTSIWIGILSLLFFRPFISEEAYPGLNTYYSLILITLSLAFLIFSCERSFHKIPYNCPILLLLIASGISTYFSLNLHSTVGELYRLTSYILILYLITQVTKKQARSIIVVVIAAGVLIALRGIYQWFFGLGLTMKYLEQLKWGLPSYQYAKRFILARRAFSTFLSPDMLAGYLIMVVPLAGGLFIDKLRGKRTTIFALITLSIILACLGLTKSLGGWLSMLGASMIFFILLFKEGYIIDRKRVAKIAAIVLAAIVLVTFSIIITQRDRFIDPNDPENSITQRLYYWKSALSIIKEFPTTGTGWGNFSSVYTKYMPPAAAEVRNAHNSYLQIWAETGIIGLIATAWLIFIFFSEGLEGLKVPGEKGLKMGILAAGSAFLIHNLIDYDYYISQVSFHWWAILGLTIAIKGSYTSVDKEKHRINPSQLIIKSIVIIILLATATLMVKSHLANVHFENGLYLLSNNKNNEATIEIRKAQILDPGYDLYHLVLAKIYEKKVEKEKLFPRDPLFNKVVKEYRRAIDLNPYSPFHYRNLGLFFLKHNMIKEAISELERAVYFYPTNPDLHNYLRITYQKINKGR